LGELRLKYQGLESNIRCYICANFRPNLRSYIGPYSGPYVWTTFWSNIQSYICATFGPSLTDWRAPWGSYGSRTRG
jgi:hypothetical protein